MAGYKVVFRADESSTGDGALLWEPSCPAMLLAVQISRNVETSEAYLQVKIRNVSRENLGSARGKATVVYSDGSSEEISFDDLDVDLAPGDQKALKAMALPRGDVESATVRIMQIGQMSGKWESSTSPAVVPQHIPLMLGEKAAAERRRKLEAASIDARVNDYAVQDHGDWWVCACGQVNVKSETCCECGASKSILLSAEDESALLVSADEWSESVYQKAVGLANDKGNASSLSEAVGLFGQVRDWKDSAERISSCEAQIEKLKTASARRMKKIAGIAAAVVVVAIAAVLFVVNVAIPDGKYNDAMKLADSGQYAEAVGILEDLGDYRDSGEKKHEFIQAELDSGQACFALSKVTSYDDKGTEYLTTTYSYKDGALAEKEYTYNKKSSEYDSKYCTDSHYSYTVDKSGAPTKRSGSDNSYTETIDQTDEWGQPTKVSRKDSDGDKSTISIEYYGQNKLKSYTTKYADSDTNIQVLFNEDGTANSSSSSFSDSSYACNYKDDGTIDTYTYTYRYHSTYSGTETDISKISVEYDDYGKIVADYENGKQTVKYEYVLVNDPKPWLQVTSGILVDAGYLLLE